MRLNELERELAALGFCFVRIGGRSHRIYADASGHVLTVSAHGGHRKVFCRGELVDIRRSLARLLTARCPT